MEDNTETVEDSKYQEIMTESKKAIKLNLINEMKSRLLKDKSSINEELKTLEEQERLLLPSFFAKMKVRTREELATTEANELKVEIESSRQPGSIHIFLTKDQKRKLLSIADALGPTQASVISGIPEANIFRWRKEGLDRKKGSGRPPALIEFEKSLRQYIFEMRGKNIGLSTKRFMAYSVGPRV